MQLDNPLWRYVSAVYSQPGVETLCLQAQSQGLQVNSLLLCIWLAQHHKAYQAEVFDHIEGQWRESFLLPFRKMRYAVRAKLPDHQSLSECYASMKLTELEMEKVDIAYLWQFSKDLPDVSLTTSIDSLALSNVDAYMVRVDGGVTPCRRACAASLIKLLLESC